MSAVTEALLEYNYPPDLEDPLCVCCEEYRCSVCFIAHSLRVPKFILEISGPDTILRMFRKSLVATYSYSTLLTKKHAEGLRINGAFFEGI